MRAYCLAVAVLAPLFLSAPASAEPAAAAAAAAGLEEGGAPASPAVAGSGAAGYYTVEPAPDAAAGTAGQTVPTQAKALTVEAHPLPDPAAETGAEVAAPAPPPPPPEPTLHVDVDLTLQRLTVTENGEVKHTWPISSARAGYRTPVGVFKPSWMARMWYSRQYDWSPMPHAIFFHRGTAIHATYATGMLGRPASHGCVRLAPANAATLFKLVNRHGMSMTKIVVHGTPNHGRIASRRGTTYRYAHAGASSSAARRSSPRQTYSYYSSPPPAAYAPPKRRAYSAAYYSSPKPRRYVSRGLFQGGY